ncbi:hypothetical protein [Janibacter terrae]|uniref:hypothetical protein n=1 Tax=Janibacter TaxID=53457 RepID=UPI00146DB0DA|nr:hypothetical protein [Janibacter terrae]
MQRTGHERRTRLLRLLFNIDPALTLNSLSSLSPNFPLAGTVPHFIFERSDHASEAKGLEDPRADLDRVAAH